MKLAGVVLYMQFGTVALYNTSSQFAFVSARARQWNFEVMSIFQAL
jgi:hypothetical protein